MCSDDHRILIEKMGDLINDLEDDRQPADDFSMTSVGNAQDKIVIRKIHESKELKDQNDCSDDDFIDVTTEHPTSFTMGDADDCYISLNESSYDSTEKKATSPASLLKEGEKGSEGNLSDVVTMHMKNCRDSYSSTLAVSDLFNKKSPILSSSVKEDENSKKDDFSIIDLDTCQMEKSMKSNTSVIPDKSFAKNIDKFESSKTKSVASLSNFLELQKDCESEDFDNYHEKETCSSVDINERNMLDSNSNELKLTFPETNLQSKGLILEDMSSNDDGITTKEIYPIDVGFHSSDLNDISLEGEDQNESLLYIPEMYTHQSLNKKKNIQSTTARLKTHTANLNNDPKESGTSSNVCFGCDLNETPPFNQAYAGNPYSSCTMNPDFYDAESMQVHFTPRYNFHEKIMNNLINGIEADKKLPPYTLSEYQKKTYIKNKIREVCGASPLYSTTQSISAEQTPSSFFQQTNTPIQPSRYQLADIQSTPEIKPPIFSSTPTQYSNWNSWPYPTLYDNHINFQPTFTDSQQFPPIRDDWSNSNIVNESIKDNACNVKSNQAEFDSEATEDADEIDDMPLFFEDPTTDTMSTCDNLSTMSVMSSSCYSDHSSVMTPMSQTVYSPPPPTSNTPIQHAYEESNLEVEDNRFGYPIIHDQNRPQPLHLYSAAMLSQQSFKFPTSENLEHNLITYDHSQAIKRYFPSMADMHHARSSRICTSNPCNYEDDRLLQAYPIRLQCNQNQIQSDKISTSTARNNFLRRNFETKPLIETLVEQTKKDANQRIEVRRLRHNEPLKQSAIRIMLRWYEEHINNPYPTKDDKVKMAAEGGITVTQVKSWFANKRNRTNNTKPKVQKRAMKEKLKKLFHDLSQNKMDTLDQDIIHQLSGIIQT